MPEAFASRSIVRSSDVESRNSNRSGRSVFTARLARRTRASGTRRRPRRPPAPPTGSRTPDTCAARRRPPARRTPDSACRLPSNRMHAGTLRSGRRARRSARRRAACAGALALAFGPSIVRPKPFDRTLASSRMVCALLSCTPKPQCANRSRQSKHARAYGRPARRRARAPTAREVEWAAVRYLIHRGAAHGPVPHSPPSRPRSAARARKGE
jgi:hypothetical protein